MNRNAFTLILATLLTMLSGCSNQSSNTEKPTTAEKSDAIYEVSNLMIGDLSVLPDIVPAMDLAAGVSSVTRIVELKNSSTSTPFLISNLKISSPSNGFSIKLNRCDSSIAPKSSCKITISFSNRELYDGQYSSSLEINSSMIQLTGSVAGKPDPSSTGSIDLQLSLDSNFQDSSNMNYRTMKIKNIGTGNASVMSVELPSEVAIRLNRCSTSLKPQEECSIQLILKDSRNTPNPIPTSWVIVTAKNPANQVSGQMIRLNTSEVQEINKLPVTISKGMGGSIISGSQVCGDNETSCVFEVEYGSDLTLTQQPAAHYNFSGWTGDCLSSGQANTCVISNIKSQLKQAGGTFVIQQFILTVNQPLHGSIVPSTASYNYGTNVPLSYSPEAGYEFLAWTGACSGSGACSVSVTQNTSVSASIGALPAVINISALQSNLLINTCSSAITVSVVDTDGNALNRSNLTTVSLSATGLTFYSDSACNSQITNITLQNQSSKVIYVKGSAAGMRSFTVTEMPSVSKISSSVNIYSPVSIAAGACADASEAMDCQLTSSGGYGVHSFTLTSAGTTGSVSSSGVFKGKCISDSGSATVLVTDAGSGMTSSINLPFPCAYQSCQDAKIAGHTSSGTYFLNPLLPGTVTTPSKVTCDMSTTTGEITTSWAAVDSGLVFYSSLDSNTITNQATSSALNSASVTQGAVSKGQKTNAVRYNRMASTSADSISLTDTMSVCAWMKNAQVNATTFFNGFESYGIGRYSKTASSTGSDFYRLTPYGYWSGVVGGSYDVSSTGSNLISNTSNAYKNLSSWHHYCTTLDNGPAKTVKIYRDGVLVQTKTGIQRWGSQSSVAYLQGVDSGTDFPTGTTGDLQPPYSDEYRVYNKVLSLGEVQSLAQYNKVPASCLDAQLRGAINLAGNSSTGTYSIDTDGNVGSTAAFNIMCDMVFDEGGWTVVIDSTNTINNCGSLSAGSASYGTCSATIFSQTATAQDGGNNSAPFGYTFRSELNSLEFSKIKVLQGGYCGFGDQVWGMRIAFTQPSSFNSPDYASNDPNYGFLIYPSFMDTAGSTAFKTADSLNKTFSSFPYTMKGISSIMSIDGRNNGLGCNNKNMKVLKLK